LIYLALALAEPEFCVEAGLRTEAPRRRVRDPGVKRGGEWGGGIPLPSRLWGLGERRKLPQRGSGWSPDRKQILVHFELEKTNVVMTNLILFVIFIAHIYSQIYQASFDIFFSFAGGQAPQAPLWLRQ